MRFKFAASALDSFHEMVNSLLVLQHAHRTLTMYEQRDCVALHRASGKCNERNCE